MRALRFLFSPSGRVPPQAFALAVVIVYAAGAASHWLTTPGVIARAGLWPFVAVQLLVIWIWYALHAKRLRDAGRQVGLAVGVGLLYTLSVVLLIIIAASFFNASIDQDSNATSALGLLLLVSIVASLLGSLNYDFSWLIVTILVVMAVVPVIVAAIFTCWAVLQPSRPELTA
jgi:uncharacterized membrane protein YhaH (DUF805 family)